MAFIKFGKKEHIEDLVHNGTVFLNTVNEFRKIDNDYRGDKNEGVSRVIQSKNATVTISIPTGKNGKTKIFTFNKDNGLYGQILISNVSYVNTNIYSLYMLEASEEWKLDRRMNQFGDYGAFIHDPIEFLNRIVKQLEIKGKVYSYGAVEYREKDTFQGELSIFDKFDNYRYQNEFRIHVQNDEDCPMVLSIGPIDDIAIALPATCFHDAIIRKI